MAPVAALAMFGAAGIAKADEVTGKITELDEAGGEIVIEDGTRYSLGGAKYEGIAVGDTVMIEFADVEGDLAATFIVKVEG